MNKVCSFCGRSEKDVKLLITGVDGYICESCAVQAYEIVKSTGLLDEDKQKQILSLNLRRCRSRAR